MITLKHNEIVELLRRRLVDKGLSEQEQEQNKLGRIIFYFAYFHANEPSCTFTYLMEDLDECADMIVSLCKQT